MALKTLNDRNMTYKAMWKVFFAGLGTCIIMCCIMGFVCVVLVRDARSIAYFFKDGQWWKGVAAIVGDNRILEAESHVRNFHHFFFTLAPEKEDIEYNVKGIALSMADTSAHNEYKSLLANGYYSGIIRDNISQTIRIDSVYVSEDLSYSKTFAIVRIISPTTITTRRLITECNLREDMRIGKERAHGFMIENWRVIQNDDIRKEPR